MFKELQVMLSFVIHLKVLNTEKKRSTEFVAFPKLKIKESLRPEPRLSEILV